LPSNPSSTGYITLCLGSPAQNTLVTFKSAHLGFCFSFRATLEQRWYLSSGG
jgi:hypothetical protein